MTQQRQMTTAYAQPMHGPSTPEDPGPPPPRELTPLEAWHSLIGGIGSFLLFYCVPLVVDFAISARWRLLDPRLALALAGIVLGVLLVSRYAWDVLYKLNKQAYIIWDLTRDLKAAIADADRLDATHRAEKARAERAEAQLELLRKQQPQTTRRGEFRPYDGPPPHQMPDNYAPYNDHPLVFDDRLRAGVDVEPNDENIHEWMNQILRHFEDETYGHIRRDKDDGVMRVRGLKRHQYDAARDKLIELGIVGGNSATGYHIIEGVYYDGILDAFKKGELAR